MSARTRPESSWKAGLTCPALRLILGAFSLCFPTGLIQAQSEQATRYHEMLVKRPQTGLVLERFIGAWMEIGSSDSLAAFLKNRTGTAADLLVLGLFHEYEGREAEAIKAYAKALEKDPANASAWVQRGRLEARMLDFDAALKSLAQAADLKPQEELALDIGKLRGRLLLRTGRTPDALKMWQDLLAAHPTDEDLVEELIDLELDEGLLDEAATLARALIDQTKDASVKVNRRLLLGDILIRGGKQADALEVYGEALAQSGQGNWVEGEVLAQIESAFRRGGDLSGLVAHLDTLQKEHPQRTALQKQQARILAETGGGDKALEVYQDLLQRTPGQRDLREAYLDLLTRQEKYPEAIAQTKLLQEQNTTDGELHIRLAGLHQKQRDLPAAKVALAAYLGLPNVTEYEHLRVARLLETWELKAEAKAAYETLVKTFPDSTTARDAQAHYLHRSGEREPALTLWRELAKTEDLDQLLAVAQALTTRLEADTARSVLHEHVAKFSKDDRFLAAIVNATLYAKAPVVKEGEDPVKLRMAHLTEAVPWALDRVRMTQDATQIEEALRQAVELLTQAAAVQETLTRLRALPTLKIQDRLLLATLLENSGERDAAEQTLREAAPEDAVVAQTRLIKLVERRQDWTRAAAEAEKLLKLPGGRTSQHLQRVVELYSRAGLPDEALKWVADWKALSPGASQPWLFEAQLLGQNGKPEESVKVLRTATRKFDEEEAVGSALASALTFAGQSAEAQRIYAGYYDKAESPEEKKRWLTSLAQAAHSRGELRKVIEQFQERQRASRDDPMPWLALAEIHRIDQNDDERRRALTEAARLKPRDVNLLQQLARAEEEGGQWQDALRTLEKAAALDTSPRSRQQIATLHLTYGDEATGYRLLFELAGGTQMAAKDALRMGDAMAVRGDWQRLAEFADPLFKTNPADYRIGYMRAVALEENGQPEQAAQAFIELLKIKEELPEVKQATASVAGALAQSVLSKRFADAEPLPPGYAEFQVLVGSGLYQAYQHQYQRRYNMRNTTTSVIQMPQVVASLPGMVAPHLVTLARALDPGTADAMWAKAAAAGLGAVKQLRHLETDMNRYTMKVSQETLEKSGWDPVLLAHAAMYSMNEPLDFEIAQRAFDAFGQKHPSLALPVIMSTLMTKPEKASVWLDQVLDAYEKQKKVSLGSFFQVTYLLGGGQRVNGMGRTFDLTPEQKTRVRNLLPAILSLYPDDASRVLPFAFIANAYRASGGWKELVDLLEAEVQRFPPGPKRQSFSGNGLPQFPSRQTTLLNPLPFPPAITLPPHVALWFQRKDIYNPNPGDDERPDPDFVAVAPLLDSVKNPVLRILLAAKADDAARVEREMKARLEAPDAGQEDWLIAACLAQQKEDPALTVEMLKKALATPMEAGLRENVDAALVKAVTMMSKPPEEAVQAGVQAMRRLRGKRVTPQQREEFIEAMTALGMSEEAAQWKRVAAMVQPAAGQRYTSSSSSRSTTRLQNLVSLGNEEAAMREAAKVLENLLTSNFLSGNSSYAKSETKRVLGYLKDKDARQKLIRKLNPGEGASTSRSRDYAGLLEMLDDAPAAAALYTRIIEQNPRDEASRIRLMILSAPKDPKKAADLLAEVPLKSLGQGLGGELLQVLNNSWDMDLEPRLGLAAAIAMRLEEPLPDGLPALQSASYVDWAADLPNILACTSRDGRYSLPYIHARHEDDSGNKVNRDSPKIRRLIEVHQRICLAQMKHPALAENGFRWYACARLAEAGDLKAVHEDLAARARVILEMAAKLPQPPRASQSRYNYNQEISARWNPGPAEFLIWLAWENGQSDRIEKDILPLLEKALPSDERNLVRLQARLWTCREKEFTTLAGEYLKAPSGSSQNSTVEQKKIVWLVDRWAERRLPGPLLDAAVLRFQKSSKNDYNAHSYFGPFLEVRQQMAPEAPLDSFLDQWLEACLGSQAGWKKRMDVWVQTRYGGGGNFNDSQAYSLGQTVETFCRQAGFLAAGMKIAGKIGLAENEAWMQSNVYNLSTQATRTAGDAVACLEAINAFAEAPGFLTLKTGGNREHPLAQLTKKIRDKPDLMKAVQTELSSLKPRTFGIEVVEALLQNDVPPALSNVIKRRAADLKTIPPERMVGMIALLKGGIPALKTPVNADPALLKALEPLLATENAAQKAEVERILKATRLQDLDIPDTIFEDQVPRLMRELVGTNRDQAKALFLNAAQMIEAKATASGWGGDTWVMGWTYRTELLDDFNDEAPGIPALVLALQLCHEDDSGMLILDGRCNEGLWGATLMDAWKKAGGIARPGPAVDELLAALNTEIGTTPPTLLALGFYELFVKLPAGVRIPVLKAALAEDSGPTRALRQELAAAGRLFFTTDGPSRSNEGLQKTLAELGGVSPAWEHYRKAMLDTQLNARVRIALAAHLCRKEIRAADPEVVRTGMALLAAEHRAFHAVGGSHHFGPLAFAFCQLPLDEAWKTAATEQWDAWVVRNSRNTESNNRNRAYSPRDESACAILGIVARLGHEDAVSRVLGESMSSLEDDPTAFITLVSNGAHAAALQWLEQHWTSFLYNAYDGVEFTQSLAEELPKFIATSAEKPDLALLGELICVTLKDPPKSAQWPGFIDHNKRILNTVPRLKTTAFSDEALRTRCLEHTADLFETLPLLHKEYAAVADKADVNAILELGSTWHTFRSMKPIAAGLAQRLWEKGDDTRLVALLEQLGSAPAQGSNEESLRAHTFSYLASPVLDYLEWHWGRGEKGDLKKVQAYIDKVIACAPRHNDCYALGTHVMLKLMLHTAGDDPAAHTAWKEGLKPDDAKELKALVLKRNTFFPCVGFFGKPKPKLPLEERLKILTGMMSDLWVQERHPASGPGVPNMINLIVNTHKLVTLDELATAGLPLAQALPRKGRTAAEAADLLAQDGREQALPLYDQAMSEAGKDTGLRANYLFRKTDLLERLDRKDEARKLLTQLTQDPKVGPNPKRTAEATLKRLQ